MSKSVHGVVNESRDLALFPYIMYLCRFNSSNVSYCTSIKMSDLTSPCGVMVTELSFQLKRLGFDPDTQHAFLLNLSICPHLKDRDA